MNNKAHLRPKDFDSNGDIIPMACKEEKGDLISREYVEKIVIAEFVDLQDGTDEWRTYVNDTCESILSKVHNAPTVEPNDELLDYVNQSIEAEKNAMTDYQDLASEDYHKGIIYAFECMKMKLM